MAAGEAPTKATDDERAVLVFVAFIIRFLLPSLGLGLVIVEVTGVLLRQLFAKLQQSAFLESGSGSSSSIQRSQYARIPSSEPRPTSVSLPPDEHGILPVSVPVKSTRRGIVYALFSLVVLSYVADGVVLIVHSLTSSPIEWEPRADSSDEGLWAGEEVYLLGCSLAITLRTLIMAWQERKLGLGHFRKAYPVATAFSLFAGETTLLGILARILVLDKRSIHVTPVIDDIFGGNPPPTSPGTIPWWTITHIATLATRVLLLLLSVLAFTPFLQRTQFLPNEYRSLLAAEQQGENGNGSSSAGYGTFANGGSSAPIKPNGIPKNGIDTAKAPVPEHKQSFFARIRILSPYLWPKKSRTLQLVARELSIHK